MQNDTRAIVLLIAVDRKSSPPLWTSFNRAALTTRVEREVLLRNVSSSVFYKNHMRYFRAPSVTGVGFRPCISLLQVSARCAVDLLCCGVFRALQDGQQHPGLHTLEARSPAHPA